MRRPILVMLLCAWSLTGLAAQSWTLSADTWNQPRSAAVVIGMAPVHAAVQTWSVAPEERRIVVLHAGGESGSLWADQLKAWLVALGVPSARIELRPGGPAGALELRVE